LQGKLEFDGAYYREIGEFLGENYLKYGFAQGTEQEVDFLVELMGIKPGLKLLDIGCGPGRHSLALARRGAHMTGIDIVPRFVDIARRQAAKERLPAEFLVRDARELDFRGEFDGAICLCEGAFGLAGSLDNHRKILRGIHRALKPGGWFVLTAIHLPAELRMSPEGAVYDAYTNTTAVREPVTSPEGETKEVTFYTTAFTYRELLLLFGEAGFEVLDAFGCIAGQFSRKPLEPDDYEIMMVARR
jgi:ubiquinone/menaquinone biosynthesis C-methylase UbiE